MNYMVVWMSQVRGMNMTNKAEFLKMGPQEEPRTLGDYKVGVLIK